MDSIIFDVDGTLWDATEDIAKSWNKTVHENTQIDITIDRERLVPELGKPVPVIFQDLFPEESVEEQTRIMDLCTKNELNDLIAVCPELFPDLQETIRTLSERLQLFIVSNCQAGYIEAFLQTTGLGRYFVDHLCPGDTGRLKAENIRMIMEQYNLEAPVYVGDTLGDFEACQSADVPLIFANYGLGFVPHPWKTIHKLSDLCEIVAEG